MWFQTRDFSEITTSPTSGSCSVGIVRSRTIATGLLLPDYTGSQSRRPQCQVLSVCYIRFRSKWLQVRFSSPPIPQVNYIHFRWLATWWRWYALQRIRGATRWFRVRSSLVPARSSCVLEVYSEIKSLSSRVVVCEWRKSRMSLFEQRENPKFCQKIMQFR
jgi:hypothetical protein